jgi:hypothetical protein
MEKFRGNGDDVPEPSPISIGKNADNAEQNGTYGLGYGRFVINKILILPIFPNLY